MTLGKAEGKQAYVASSAVVQRCKWEGNMLLVRVEEQMSNPEGATLFEYQKREGEGM